MTIYENLKNEFKRLEGQPVRIIMNDHHVFYGIVLSACEYSCRILDRCNDVLLVEYSHIDAVEEPRMCLHNCCQKCWDNCDGDEVETFDERC